MNGRPAHAFFLLAGVVEDAVCAVVVDQVYYPEEELASPLEVGLANGEKQNGWNELFRNIKQCGRVVY